MDEKIGIMVAELVAECEKQEVAIIVSLTKNGVGTAAGWGPRPEIGACLAHIERELYTQSGETADRLKRQALYAGYAV